MGGAYFAKNLVCWGLFKELCGPNLLKIFQKYMKDYINLLCLDIYTIILA